MRFNKIALCLLYTKFLPALFSKCIDKMLMFRIHGCCVRVPHSCMFPIYLLNVGSTIQSYMAKKHKRWAEENPTGNVNQRVYAELLHKVNVTLLMPLRSL